MLSSSPSTWGASWGAGENQKISICGAAPLQFAMENAISMLSSSPSTWGASWGADNAGAPRRLVAAAARAFARGALLATPVSDIALRRDVVAARRARQRFAKMERNHTTNKRCRRPSERSYPSKSIVLKICLRMYRRASASSCLCVYRQEKPPEMA